MCIGIVLGGISFFISTVFPICVQLYAYIPIYKLCARTSTYIEAFIWIHHSTVTSNTNWGTILTITTRNIQSSPRLMITHYAAIRKFTNLHDATIISCIFGPKNRPVISDLKSGSKCLNLCAYRVLGRFSTDITSYEHWLVTGQSALE